MVTEFGARLRWWLSWVVLPVVLLGLGAIALSVTDVDGRSLEPFYDRELGTFVLRRDWFMNGVLHVGGKYCVLLAALGLVLLASIGGRWPRLRPWRSRFFYVALCVAISALLAGLWKDMALQGTPWNTSRFGGSQPWPGSGPAFNFAEWFGSPGAHAAGGFAWTALFFVGAAAGVRGRAWWLAPGLCLGFLFALAQHVRGAHQPSHQLWSLALAWSVAASLAWLFRRAGWMHWEEQPRPASDSETTPEAINSWFFASCGLFLGTAFFTVDLASDEFEHSLRGAHETFEVLEVLFMGPGLAVVGYLLAERVREHRRRHQQREEAERERRFQLLGRTAAAVAHEVRNPLHTLRLILDEQHLEIPELCNHALRGELVASLERIDRAVELVYRLARPGSGDAIEVDLVRVVRAGIAGIGRGLASEARFGFTSTAESAPVLSPPAGLAMVVENLLRNAHEAAPPEEQIAVELGSRERHWLLRLRNSGSFQATLEESGSDVRAKPAQGLGIGLRIARQIATESGGQIELRQRGGEVVCELSWPMLPEVRA